jgi:phosphoribosylaminoimidazolecarboxamide formyltransferase/IMP cyclohydrolase
VRPIDVVVVNLYPFAETVARGAGEADAIEQIDIGGPALLRAAAKNYRRVTVLPDPECYEEFLHELRCHGGDTSLAFRRRLAGNVFSRVADYDAAIAAWLTGREASAGPARARLPLRYGENPHQQAHLELPAQADGAADLGVCGLAQLGGKELSYNNLVDLVAALKLVCDFDEPCCAVIKHTNPCGCGLGQPGEALELALRCDPESAFGGVFAFNAPVDAEVAGVLHGRFLEIVAAPAFAAEALALLRRKKNVRLLTYDRARFRESTRGQSRSFGVLKLAQDEDEDFPELKSWRVVAGPEPTGDVARALQAAWKVCKHVKSNAIVLCDARATLGIGAGQMSRVDAARLAVRKAADQGLDLHGAVAASDGFFPFPDGIERLQAEGIRAVIAPSGSIRDEEVSARANELGLTLVFTGRRHFRH